ncbi:MAG: class I tRNA ligase family protein, partial [Aggregatilineales bacterium]
DREKTGVFTGAYAINPVSGAKIPIWIADYVMISYGTGAIMAVPYGDQRDFAFARKFGLDIIAVVKPDDADETPDPDTMTEAYSGTGTMVNSGAIDGKYHNGAKGRKSEAVAAAIDHLEANQIGKEEINYRLRDWLISRQRYWGGPIPMVYDENGEPHVLPDDALPVELPADVEFMPTGRSPLTYHEPFYNAGNGMRRETDTLDTFMCSSWYQLRYLSPNNDDAPFTPEEAAYWLPVDAYTGGAEHAVMHLLYTRYFTKALRDMGIFDDAATIAAEHGRDVETMFNEPMTLLRNQGQVLGGERPGDYLLCEGHFSGDKFIATRVQVVDWNDVPAGFEGVVGELMKRVESNLFVGADNTLVEVTDGAEINIPTIDGANNVNQLKHHLEIQRMSKSKGNVVNPDELVAEYGADAVRAYLMFAFDWQKGGPWDPDGIKGILRWLNDVWDIVSTGVDVEAGNAASERNLERAIHQAVDKVTSSMEKFSFNTAIAGLMEVRNILKPAVRKNEIGSAVFVDTVNIMLRLMAPITPHIAEELWSQMGFEGGVHVQDWPEYDAEKAKEDEVELVVMINGKPRENIAVAAGIEKADAEAQALASEAAQRALNGSEPRKVIFIPGKKGSDPKVNIVVAGK